MESIIWVYLQVDIAFALKKRQNCLNIVELEQYFEGYFIQKLKNTKYVEQIL